ncbi:MAG: flagellar motor protein MotB [Rhodothermales bacterium]|nr:flagellar motor protein MotB [Rhodothermales bacterium]
MRRLTLLGLVFVFVGCAGSKDVIRRQQEEIAELRVQNEQLRDELGRAGMNVPPPAAAPGDCGNGQCVGETITVLLTDLYFESGSAALNRDGVERLARVADEIRSAYPNRRLRIEGHTDSNPIGSALKQTYPSNWELSAARAASVVRHFQWTHTMDPGRFEVVGFGHYAPVATNDTAEGRRENRRVRIAVLPR